ncbi:hypothetical protein SKAU_G00139510 [Synaphobranchus kaupii]|uniref:SET domain-containing protein n=1 Tax=Synaphobranchus kaupii TaxID=118154 RepID=A0A9Q1J4A5_SYNKA|nr:hypothetical protein SKAU_G00139510 [Synaphobranchus kaupii]
MERISAPASDDQGAEAADPATEPLPMESKGSGTQSRSLHGQMRQRTSAVKSAISVRQGEYVDLQQNERHASPAVLGSFATQSGRQSGNRQLRRHPEMEGACLEIFRRGKGQRYATSIYRIGVIATVPFHKGQVVCDYPRSLISEAEGNRRHQSGYLLFFKGDTGERLCIDGTTSPCACHPHLDTCGRRLNHSKMSCNVSPKNVTLNLPDGPKDVVLFLSRGRIEVGEEHLWDYGVTKAFGGEGMDLTWLDQ